MGCLIRVCIQGRMSLILDWSWAFYCGPRFGGASLGNECVEISMHRGICRGRCPEYDLTIEGDGVVSYEGFHYVKIKGKHTAQLPISTVNYLTAEFQRIDFFKLKDNYSEPVT